MMLSWPITPELNNKITMNQYTGHWSPDHEQELLHYQNYSVAGSHPSENGHSPSHHMAWSSGQESEHSDQGAYFGTNRDRHDSFLQHNSIQYIPLTPEPVPYPVFHLPRPYQNNTIMAKKHRARIAFVPTKTGNFKAIVKRKRQRTIFTRKQVEALEEIFKSKQYITREDREVIVNQLQLNDKAVKIWFQNRRLKDKKGPEQIEEETDTVPLTEGRSSPDIARLNYVESKINEKTDEFGYVTLDDSVMRDLFDVIDDFLTDRRHYADDISEGGSTFYEPISPASASDSNDEENASGWKPSEPNESLQRLFDLQTILSL